MWKQREMASNYWQGMQTIMPPKSIPVADVPRTIPVCPCRGGNPGYWQPWHLLLHMAMNGPIVVHSAHWSGFLEGWCGVEDHHQLRVRTEVTQCSSTTGLKLVILPNRRASGQGVELHCPESEEAQKPSSCITLGKPICLPTALSCSL